MSRYEPPFRTCEAVLAEAAHVVSRLHRAAPTDLIALGRHGAFEIAFRIDEQWLAIEETLTKYRGVPASLADACLIQCAEIFDEPRIVTFDTDFRVYRWGRSKRFEILD
jgi:predicted nucleic acid-binding protein